MKFSTPISGFDLREFTPDMMIALCVGAGCDYLVRTYYSYVVLCCVVLCCVNATKDKRIEAQHSTLHNSRV